MIPWELHKNRYHHPSLFGQYLCGKYLAEKPKLTLPDPPMEERCVVCEVKAKRGQIPKQLLLAAGKEGTTNV